MSNLRQMIGTISEVAQSEEFEQFRANARDFLSAREQGGAEGSQITEMIVPLADVAETVNRSFQRRGSDGETVNVISPVVVPKGGRSFGWVFWTLFWGFVGIVGLLFTSLFDMLPIIGGGAASTWFGPHYWLLIVAYIGFSLWRNSYVMVPDGCEALITRYGKLERVAPAGRVMLWDPRKKVSYIVNTTKEYPYNAPIREAPTSGRVNASVDLFLQFKVENPAEFIFTLGGTRGFSEKLENAISEVTRALIYEQKAEDIYDLVGESTQPLLDSLNRQFTPAVRFVNANITHAEPSSQQYRMDLAAPEMVRVAKEAYTYEYELKLRKEQDEGTFNRELASLRENLSEIRADIARYQAQIDTAREKEINKANAYAEQMMVEAESEAKANSALLEAQALDIRAVNSAYYPEILEHRYQQEILNQLEAISPHLPQVVTVGATAAEDIDFMRIGRHMLGASDGSLYTDADMQQIRERMKDIVGRINERSEEIRNLMDVAPVDAARKEDTEHEHTEAGVLED